MDNINNSLKKRKLYLSCPFNKKKWDSDIRPKQILIRIRPNDNPTRPVRKSNDRDNCG